MVLPESLMVVLVSTLSGGVERVPLPSVFQLWNASAGNSSQTSPRATLNGSCGLGVAWGECTVLDGQVHPLHIGIPWALSLGTIVILSMPTVLLRSRKKERGLRAIAANLFQFLGLLMCCSFVGDYPIICFTLSLHSCVRLLVQLEISDAFVGGYGWWTLRYLTVWTILCLQLWFGPSVSVIRWPTTPLGSALPCAYLAHLVGCLLPDLILTYLRWFVAFVKYIKIRDD